MLLQQRQAIAVAFDICLASPNILGHMLRYPVEPEGVNKLLHDLLGLNFDQQCLDFHRTNREIRTTELFVDPKAALPDFRKRMGRLLC